MTDDPHNKDHQIVQLKECLFQMQNAAKDLLRQLGAKSDRSTEACRNCRFSTAGEGWLECRRHAPFPNPEEGVIGRWPMVEAGYWCGDWESDDWKTSAILNP